MQHDDFHVDDRPLATQTAAPPAVPPRRPIVGLAMADDDEARFQALVRQLVALGDECRALAAANRETIARLLRRLDR